MTSGAVPLSQSKYLGIFEQTTVRPFNIFECFRAVHNARCDVQRSAVKSSISVSSNGQWFIRSTYSNAFALCTTHAVTSGAVPLSQSRYLGIFERTTVCPFIIFKRFRAVHNARCEVQRSTVKSTRYLGIPCNLLYFFILADSQS